MDWEESKAAQGVRCLWSKLSLKGLRDQWMLTKKYQQSVSDFIVYCYLLLG